MDQETFDASFNDANAATRDRTDPFDPRNDPRQVPTRGHVINQMKRTGQIPKDYTEGEATKDAPQKPQETPQGASEPAAVPGDLSLIPEGLGAVDAVLEAIGGVDMTGEEAEALEMAATMISEGNVTSGQLEALIPASITGRERAAWQKIAREAAKGLGGAPESARSSVAALIYRNVISTLSGRTF